DAAGADDRHPSTYRPVAGEHVEVAQHARVVAARKTHATWQHAGGDHDLVITGGLERGGPGLDAQLHFDPGVGEAMAVIAQGFVELLLARNPLRVVELAADPAGAVDQGHRV